ncbi:tetratricopeptide repeat protein [Myxococcus sp. SDU36]|uniref:tetratricopeptide repeat protein n=1 Tax=Myxococcus sp. SDU36 TaxID=2831967 RepID=UPI002543F643|nr:tetratricopeptide repeat protein [Myxococcus sp. SDU36]WIG97480.1 tetratricopeptide repeat protein [Myxococcus sp. SDU36]
MALPALHHAKRPAFAATWPTELLDVITARLADEVHAQDLRVIVLAPTQDRLRVGVWLGTEWDNYPDVTGDAAAAGFVSLTPWLDELDALSLGERTLPQPEDWTPLAPLHFHDEVRNASFLAWWLELHRALVASAIELGTRLLAERFEQPVGVFVSMDGTEAQLVSFCHPRGAPLWPVQEHRKEHGYGSAYPRASLEGDTLVLFYPEGEGENGGPPAIRCWSHAQVVRARADRKALHVTARFKGEDFDVRFSAGHTHPRFGGPPPPAIINALLGFFRASGGLDAGDVAPPLPASAEEVAATLAALPTAHEQLRYVTGLARVVSLERLISLLAGLEAAAPTRGALQRALAADALDAGQWATVLAHFEQISEEDRSSWMETRALTGLGRWEDVLRVASDDALPERALALGALGRLEEALPLVDKDSSGSDALAVLALLQQAHAPERASATLRAALAGGVREHLLVHVEASPGLSPILKAHRAFEAAVLSSRDACERLELSPLRLEPARILAVEPAPRALIAPLEDANAESKRSYFLAFVERPGGRWWGADRKGTLREYRADGGAKTLATFSPRIKELVALESGVVAAVGSTLVLLDAAGQARATLQSPRSGDGPMVAQGALLACANGEAINLYRATGDTLQWLAPLAMPGHSAIGQLGFTGPGQLLVTAGRHLVLFDVSEPTRPVPLRRWTDDVDFKLVSTREGAAALTRGEWVWLVEVGEVLRGKHKLHLGASPTAAASDAAPWAFSARGRVVEVSGAVAREVFLVGEDGSRLGPRALSLWGSHGTAVTHDTVLPLSSVELDTAPFTAHVEALLPRVREWLFGHLEAWARDGVRAPAGGGHAPLGGLVLTWMTGLWAGLRGQPPCSVVSLGYDNSGELSLEGVGAPPPALVAPASSMAAERQTRALEEAREQRAMHEQLRVCRALLREAAAAFAHRTSARTFVLALDTEDGLEVLDVLPGGGAALPHRAADAPRVERTLRELLSAADAGLSMPNLVARARRDAAVRADVLALLEQEGLEAAGRVSLELLDVDLEGCARAWLAVAARDVHQGLPGLIALARRGHAGARARLLSLVDASDTRLALQARVELGRADEDATVPLLERYLASPGEVDEVLARALADLGDARIVRLRAALESARARQGAETDRLLLPLVRSGWAPDEETVRAGNEARLDESEFVASVFSDDAPEGSASAVRHWTAQRIASAVAATGPLWPQDVPLEPHRTGWQRFFTLAWPYWESRGVLPMLYEILAKCEQEADAELAYQLLFQGLLRGDPRGAALGRALARNPAHASRHAETTRLATFSRLQFGWSLVKARRLPEARQVADAALADAPEDGQVRFFDARVAWLERDDPTAALERIESALRAARDSMGRARLLNLYGAALDALGRHAEALDWFHKAFAANESSVDGLTGKTGDPEMSHAILSNIAEMHWRLGQREEARRHAEQAARRGSTTEIVMEILAETRA